MEQQIQQLQNQIAALKIRAFDAQEQAGAYQAQLKEQTSMMQKIVDELRVPGDEEGNVSYEAVIQFVKELVASQKEVDQTDVIEIEPEIVEPELIVGE